MKSLGRDVVLFALWLYGSLDAFTGKNRIELISYHVNAATEGHVQWRVRSSDLVRSLQWCSQCTLSKKQSFSDCSWPWHQFFYQCQCNWALYWWTLAKWSLSHLEQALAQELDPLEKVQKWTFFILCWNWHPSLNQVNGHGHEYTSWKFTGIISPIFGKVCPHGGEVLSIFLIHLVPLDDINTNAALSPHSRVPP